MFKKISLSLLRKSVAMLSLMAFFSQSTLAAVWYVDTNADTDPDTCVADDAVNDDNCTFRDAVTQMGDGDTIRFLENQTALV